MNKQLFKENVLMVTLLLIIITLLFILCFYWGYSIGTQKGFDLSKCTLETCYNIITYTP